MGPHADDIQTQLMQDVFSAGFNINEEEPIIGSIPLPIDRDLCAETD